MEVTIANLCVQPLREPVIEINSAENAFRRPFHTLLLRRHSRY